MLGRRAHASQMRPSPVGIEIGQGFQELGIADNGGERRAQLVGDIADKVALQPLSLGQSRRAFFDRLFQLARGGDVGKGDQGGAVRQGAGLIGDEAAVRGADLAGNGGAHLGIRIADPRLQFAPEGAVMHQGQAKLGQAVEVRSLDHLGGRQAPEPLKRFIVQAQATIGAIDRDRVVQLVERGLLHLDLGVILSAQAKLARDVGIEDQKAAQGMGLARNPQRATVRQAPQLVRAAVQGLIMGEFLGLPAGIVGRLRQSAALAQAVQHLAMGGLVGQPGGL